MSTTGASTPVGLSTSWSVRKRHEQAFTGGKVIVSADGKRMAREITLLQRQLREVEAAEAEAQQRVSAVARAQAKADAVQGHLTLRMRSISGAGACAAVRLSTIVRAHSCSQCTAPPAPADVQYLQPYCSTR